MRRREFITLMSGAAAAGWPLAARAQQGERMRRVGVLIGSDDNTEARALFAEFQQALEQLGWTYGRNIQIDIRWGSDPERIIAYAKELVRLSPDVIFAGPTNVVLPLQQATRSWRRVCRGVFCPLRFPPRPRASEKAPSGNAWCFFAPSDSHHVRRHLEKSRREKKEPPILVSHQSG